MKKQHTAPQPLALTFTCAVLGFASAANAASILNDDFESYSPLDENLASYSGSPWVTGGITDNSNINVVSSTTSFGGSDSQVAHHKDTDGSANPSFKYTFASSTLSAINIQFDFQLNSTSGVPTFQLLDSTGNAGLFLNLTRGGSQAAMVNQLNGSGAGDAITPLDVDTWYRVTIAMDAISGATETFGLTVEESGVATPIYTSTSNLSIRNNLPNYNSILFLQNSLVGSKSDFYIDNISITSVPEPSFALLGGLGSMVLLRRRRA